MASWPYSTKAWRDLRQAKLSSQPTCEPCERRGRTMLAIAVDHVVAINAGGEAFPPLDQLMSMCEPCHNSKTARMDRGNSKGAGRFKGCDVNGDPLDDDDGWRPACGPDSPMPGAFRSPRSAPDGPSWESGKDLLMLHYNKKDAERWV